METILVVDDERVIREGCRRIFEAEGYRVVTAESGPRALEILEADGGVDVVFCDLKMPGMSAIDVLGAVTVRYPDLPLIVITGHGTVDNAVECMKSGAYDFVTKPFQVDHLVLVARRALEKRSLERRAKELQEAQARSLYDLAMEQSRIHAIVNCMADGVLVTNRDLEVVFCNSALKRLLELRDPVALPGSLEGYGVDAPLAGVLQDLLGADEREERFASREAERRGTHLRALSAPVHGPGREILGTVTVFQDITDFKRLDAMKSDFVHMVSHELRSPMAAVQQQISVILDGLAGEVTTRQREMLGRSQERIQGLLDLVNELLDIARMEGGGEARQMAPLQLRTIIESTVELMRPQAEHLSIELSMDLPSEAPLVQADPRGMEEVFTNLIGNAIRYSPDGGTVTISAIPCGSYLEVLVSDTGIGIPAEEIPKIFDKFYRVKHPRTRKVIGTGLGLAIVKGIVDAHRGAIRVESEPGVGTTFRVTLPTAP